MIVIKRTTLKIAERLLIVIIVIIITSVIVKAADKKLNNQKNINLDNGVCPEEMVYVPSGQGGFCIDKYEASAGEKCVYNNPKSQMETLANINIKECLPATAADAIPWRNLSQNQAALLCAKAGKRLPTNREWLDASLGTPDSAKNWTENECQIDGNWPSQPGITGSGKNCVSSAGAYDMVGNVWEWVDGTISEGNFRGRQLPDGGFVLSVGDDGLPGQTNSQAADANYFNDYFWIKKSGLRGIARGGYWDNKDEAGQYAVYAVSEPSFTGDSVGFRCAK